jgi:hypothetical protein
MARLRFTTARDLFEAFPTAEADLHMEPTDEPSLAFLDGLVSAGELIKAIAFLAYLLPRREAVWWACQSVRALTPQLAKAEEPGIETAEAWVKEPEEERRRDALMRGVEGKRLSPTTWLALAAGWAGGVSMPGVPFPPYQTARAAATAINIAISRIAVGERDASMKKCIENGKQLAMRES